MIMHHRTIHLGLNLVSLGGYYFHQFDINHRLVLQLVKPGDDIQIVELYTDSDVPLGLFCRSNGLGYDTLNFTNPIIHTRAPSLDQFGPEPTRLQGAAPNIHLHSAPVIDAPTIPTLPPITPPGRTDSPIQTPTSATFSEETFVPQLSLSNSRASEPSSSGSDTVTMHVPELQRTRDAVTEFTKGFVKGLNKGVRTVTCSMCTGDKQDKQWDAKPSSLARHGPSILSHLGQLIQVLQNVSIRLSQMAH
ncbi:unnamed protein product, partial [Rhizoctonia solani]